MPGREGPPRIRGEILIIDDESMIGSSLQRLLQSRGYRAEFYTDPLKALELLRREPLRFGIVITDLSMPSLNGHEILKETRAINPSIKVALSSGNDNLKREAKNFDAWIEKPYSIEQLEEVLQRMS